MRRWLIFFALLPAGCANAAHPTLAAASPLFSPEQFFVGRTEGEGAIKVMLSHRNVTVVHGIGRLEKDGTILLDQIVAQVGAKTKHREWRLRQLSPGHYGGTLTDATGPVIGEVTGNCFHVRYRMKSGIEADQRLYEQWGGQTVLNRMVFRKMGIVVAHMTETIHRIG